MKRRFDRFSHGNLGTNMPGGMNLALVPLQARAAVQARLSGHTGDAPIIAKAVGAFRFSGGCWANS